MNMSDLMKQAQQFQSRLNEVQQELGKTTVTGVAGAGMVTAVINGNSELVNIQIEPGIVNPDDVQMLQDLVAAAVNDGLQKAKEAAKAEMAKLTGGVNIPGLL